MSKAHPTVYLAGPITGHTYDGCTEWRDAARQRFEQHGIRAYSPMRAKKYLAAIGTIPAGASLTVDTASRNIYAMPLSSDKGICTRDRFDCMGSDLVLMNLVGAQRISVGSMIEIGWADAARRPIVLAMELGNIHTHAMVNHLAGYVVPTLDEAIDIALAILLEG